MNLIAEFVIYTKRTIKTEGGLKMPYFAMRYEQDERSKIKDEIIKKDPKMK